MLYGFVPVATVRQDLVSSVIFIVALRRDTIACRQGENTVHGKIFELLQEKLSRE